MSYLQYHLLCVVYDSIMNSNEYKGSYNDIVIKGFSSVVGAGTAEIVTLPLCTIKTNFQVNNTASLRKEILSIYTKNGMKGFYGASVPAIFGQVVSTSSKFTFYQIIKHERKTHDGDLLNNSLNGMVGGILGSLLSHPIDVVKNSYQRDKQIFNEIKKAGYKTFYRGYTQTIAKNIMLYGTLFPLYDKYKTLFNGNVIQSTVLTTITTCTLLQPIDYIRTRYMAGNFNNIGWNPINYYKGFSISLTRSMIHFSLTMFVTENIFKHVKSIN